MALTLRTAVDARSGELVRLLDEAFERPEREARLVAELARAHPQYDPGLALLAVEDGRPLGYALLLPREILLRGAPVRIAVVAMIATRPAARRRGVASFLLRTGLAALADRGLRGAVAIGVPELFRRCGFASAFNLYTAVASRNRLPDGDSPGWRALSDRDIPRLRELLARSYADVDGTELRTGAVIDWESPTPDAHVLVLAEGDEPRAHVRFRVGEKLEVREASASDAAASEAALCLLRRLCDEHRRGAIDVHLAPRHPLSRALFRRGCELRANDFHGSALLHVADWPGLLADTAPAWEAALRAAGARAASFAAGGRTLRLALQESGLCVTEGPREDLHLALPDDLGPPLLTGQLSWQDLVEDAESRTGAPFDPAARQLARSLFPGGAPMWTYGPVFELADA